MSAEYRTRTSVAGTPSSRIPPALDRDEPDLIRHPGVDDAMDAGGGRDHVESEPARDRGDGALGSPDVECHESAGEARRIQIPEEHARVGDRRVLTTAVVA